MSKKGTAAKQTEKFKLPRKLKKAKTKEQLKKASEYLWAEIAKGFENQKATGN